MKTIAVRFGFLKMGAWYRGWAAHGTEHIMTTNCKSVREADAALVKLADARGWILSLNEGVQVTGGG